MQHRKDKIRAAADTPGQIVDYARRNCGLGVMRDISKIWPTAGMLLFLCAIAPNAMSAPAIPGVHMVLEVDVGRGAEQKNREDLLNRSVEVVNHQMNKLGAKSVTVERDGGDRIRVELTGFSDLPLLRKLFGPSPEITLQLVDETASADAIRAGTIPSDEVILDYAFAGTGNNQSPLAMHKQVLLAGDNILDAISGMDERSGFPVVNVRFDQKAAEQLANITKANVGNRLAIVMDGKILSAPRIVEPILGGSIQISGQFTTKEADSLAMMLRGSALPATIRISDLRATQS